MKAIDLKHNIFLRAQVRIALMYLLFSVLLIGFTSAILFFRINDQNRSQFHKYTQEGRKDEERLEGAYQQESERAILGIFIVTDGLIIVLASITSFFLAGQTLKPIRLSQDAQKRFLTDASHELRTPLTIMQTNLQVGMDTYKHDPEVRSMLQYNLEEVQRMSRIVENLLVLSRIDSGQFELHEERIDISALLQKVMTQVASYAAAKQVVLECSAPAGMWVTGDRDMFYQSFLNIIKNGIDYTDPGGSVHVSCEKTGHEVKIQVQDTGIGIPAGDLPHIFDRFYKAANVTGRKQNGHGIGLSVVKWGIEQQHGRISIKSTQNRGTNVTVLLPSRSS